MNYDKILHKLERLADEREARRKRRGAIVLWLLIAVGFFLVYALIAGIRII